MADNANTTSVVKQQKVDPTVTQPGSDDKSTFKTITSRLNHPVTLDYGDEKIVIPPRGSQPNIDPSKLDATLPKGVVLGANTGKK